MSDRGASTALPMYLYRDPAEAYEITEAKTCKGCVHESTMTINGQKIPLCDKNQRYGKRCKHYVERRVFR